MIELAYIREHLEEVRQALVDLNTDAPLDDILTLDEQRRSILAQIEALRAERNRVSKEMPGIQDKHVRQSMVEAMRRVGDQIKLLEGELGPIQQRLDDALLRVPNMPDPCVPIGSDDSHNIVIRQDTDLPTFDFKPCLTGIWERRWGSWILSAVSKYRGRVFTCSKDWERNCSAHSSPLCSMYIRASMDTRKCIRHIWFGVSACTALRSCQNSPITCIWIPRMTFGWCQPLRCR